MESNEIVREQIFEIIENQRKNNDPPETILAYAKKSYKSSVFQVGYVVLYLNGEVEWLKEDRFEKIFASQKKGLEAELSEHGI